jgi:hypothetical protein
MKQASLVCRRRLDTKFFGYLGSNHEMQHPDPNGIRSALLLYFLAGLIGGIDLTNHVETTAAISNMTGACTSNYY